LMKISEKMDSGPVILQKPRAILETDTALSLEEKLSRDAAELLLEGLRLIESKQYRLTPQDEEKASFAPKLKNKDCLIEWAKPAEDIYNLIRGTLNWTASFTYYKGKRLKIYRARLESSESKELKPGEILKISASGITVAAGKNCLLLEELQPEGKRIMTAQEFVAGHKVIVGERLGF
jgi:methionyl-tRNA formyltransferase